MIFQFLCFTVLLHSLRVSGITYAPKGNKPVAPSGASLNTAIAVCEAIAQVGQIEARSSASAIASGLGPVLAEVFCSAMVQVDSSTAAASAFSLARATSMFSGTALSAAASQALVNSVGPQIAQAVGSVLARMGSNNAKTVAQALVNLYRGSSTGGSEGKKLAIAIARCEATAQSKQGLASAEAIAIVQTLGAGLAIAVCSAFAEVRQSKAQKAASSLLKICTQPKLGGSVFSQAASSAFADIVDQGIAQAAASAFAQAGKARALAAAKALAHASGVSFAKTNTRSQLPFHDPQIMLSAAPAIAKTSSFATTKLRHQQAPASTLSGSPSLTRRSQMLFQPDISKLSFFEPQTGPTSVSSQTSALSIGSTLALPDSIAPKSSPGMQISFSTRIGTGSSIGSQTLPTSALSRSSVLSVGSQLVLPTFAHSQSSASSRIIPGLQSQISKRAIAEAKCFAIAQTELGFAVARAEAVAIVNAFKPDLAIAICSAFAGVPRNVAQTAAYSLVKLSKSSQQSVALSQAVTNAVSAVMQPSAALAVAQAFASLSRREAIAAADALAIALGVPSVTAQSSSLASVFPVNVFSGHALPRQVLSQQAFVGANAFTRALSGGIRLGRRNVRQGKAY